MQCLTAWGGNTKNCEKKKINRILKSGYQLSSNPFWTYFDQLFLDACNDKLNRILRDETHPLYFSRLGGKALKHLNNSYSYQATFQDVGEHDSGNTMEQLETFVCQLYGSRTISNINTLCFVKAKEQSHPKGNFMLSEKETADSSLLPPVQPSFMLHAKRVNYRLWFGNNPWPPSDLPPPEIYGFG